MTPGTLDPPRRRRHALRLMNGLGRLRPLGAVSGILGVAAVALAAYAPALGCGFVWNDGDYVTRPALRSLAGLGRIWFQPGATEQYYPVLHTAFWLEHRLWGDTPAAYHLLNILLHAAAAALLAFVLGRLWKGGVRAAGPWMAALLFALHPLGVESVVWISEQKNTLSAVFYLLAALLYLRSRGGAGTAPSLASYLLATALFLLALLSKTTTAVLPGVLLVALWWSEGGIDRRRDAGPLGAWLVLGAAAGLFSAWVERSYVGADGSAFALGPAARLLLAGRVFWFYLAKCVWPDGLVFIYRRWAVDPLCWWQWLFPAGALALAVVSWRLRKRSRAPLAVVLLFSGSLFPVLGFFNVYGFLFSYVADHWAYLALLPMAGAAAAAWEAWARRCASASRICAGAVLCFFAASAWRRIPAYRSEETLYRTIIGRNPEAWLAHANLGILLVKAGRLPEAVAEYRTALRLNPGNPQAHNNLGNALSRLGQDREAAAEYEQALRLKPDFAEPHNGLGSLYEREGLGAEALAEYREALLLEPSFADPHVNVGNLLLRAGAVDGAVAEYRRALDLEPESAAAHCCLGTALERERRLEEAVEEYRTALRLAPGMAEAHNDLGNALLESGRSPEACAEYRAALAIAPGVPEIHFNLGVALARSGLKAEAAREMEQALRLKPDYREARSAWDRLELGR